MRIAGRPAGSVAARKPNVRKRVRRRQPLQLDRRVEPLQQVLAQRRPVAHQLHQERIRQHEIGGAGHMAERGASEGHVRDNGCRPLVALGEARMKRAHRRRLQAGTPAQRVDRVAAGREQVAASALAGADPGPAAVPVGDPRQVLRAREADLAQPAAGPQPPREDQKRVVAQLERDDRPDAGLPHRVANAHQLGDVEAGRLLEQQVLAGPGRRHGLLGVQMVRGRDRDDVHVGRREHVIVAGRDARAGQRDAVLGEVGAGAVGVARAQPGDGAMRVVQKRRDVLRRAPADAANGDAKFAIRSGHFCAL